ncbi:MAG: putative hydroxymethylpyrimidine transport system permease protein [Solirubrobacteraceae bacterium]|jgi:NitT/TauT family transport system permease protein/putative hydroxymethylpyrimidine transport system permease protein|nr:putative hydroxymethylpyrimidine transport system permease protein [Solirubrobacteraceae bacterium]
MYALGLLIVLLGGWEAAVRLDLVDELVLPAPTSVAQSLVDDRSLLAHDLLVTAYEAVLGLLAATLVGAAIAIVMHLWEPARKALYPYVVGSQALPMVVLAAPLLILLGFGLAPKVVIVALVCFFPVTVNLFDGLRTVDPDQRKLLRSLHASRLQTLTLLEARAALPQFFTGLRVAAAVSVIGAVFAEYGGSEDGLGHLVLTSLAQLESARTFAATFLLFALAVLLYGALALVERRLLPWTRPT